MAPRIEVASNAAATTWTDITAAVNLESLVVGGHAHEFEIGTGSGFDLDDDTAAAILPTRRQLRVWEDVPTPDVRLFQGRIVSVETGRGRRFDGNAVQHDVQLADQNQDLRGLQVDRWVRPAETDYTRAVAARNAFLHGSPRASTDLAMTYLPNTNTVTMPKKVYERTDPAGVFADLIGQSGKEGFLTQDGELFYDLPTSTAYSSSLAITDNSPNLTTEFPPMDGAGRSTDGTELYTGAILITPKGSRIGSTNRAAVETAHDVWRTVIADDDVTATNPIQALTAYLNEFAKDDLGYKCSVTLPASATDKIRPGMTINFRSSAAGVLAPIGVRIVRLMWRWAGLGFWIADLELDYPMKVNVKRPRGSLAATASIVTPLPGSVLTDGSLGLDPFADDVRPVPIVAALPTLPDVTYYPTGQLVTLTVDGKIYRNVAGVWKRDVDGADLLAGSIDITPFASTIRPVAIVGSLPTLPTTTYPIGSTVVLTTDGKLYRNVANVWTKSTDGADIIADSITAGQIAAGGIGASEIAAGAVSADKLSVGAKPTFNEVLNGSFEDAGGSANGWTTQWYTEGTPVAADAVAGGAISKSGSYIFQMRCAAGVGSGALGSASKSWPVNPGDVYYLSCFALSGSASVDGFFFRLSYGTSEDFSQAASTGDLDIVANGALTTAWVQKQGYVTIPAGATWARVVLLQYHPTTQVEQYIDDVICYRMASGVRNSTAETLIDAAGITVLNGKISVVNPGSVVIIDGTSDMFKISASGSLSKAFPAAGNVASVGANLTGLGNPAVLPMMLSMVTTDGSAASNPRMAGEMSITAPSASDGNMYFRAYAYILKSVTNTVQAWLNAESNITNPVTTAKAQYYTLIEVGI